jgi:hypothetical protein
MGHAGDRNQGFNAKSDAVDIVETAAGWQSAGDPRMFKVILSPEFGERLELKALTRELVRRMERDLDLPLEWVAAAHFNTEHPHVHMLLRGIGGGQEVRLAPQYVRSGIRKHAEDLCTVQLGYRTEADRAQARAREVDQPRFTSLDYALQHQRGQSQVDSPNADHFAVDVAGADGLVEQRLHVLRSMGLAKPVGRGRWEVRTDFDSALRSMKRAADRQKMLASCSALISDDRLPMELTPPSRITYLEGRVVGHVLDDLTGRTHMVLEGTDAKIHLIPHDAAVESARQKRLLQPNSFVELSSGASGQRSRLVLRDLGSSEDYLASDQFALKAKRLVAQGVVPSGADWGGWLGRYERALRGAAEAISRSGGRTKASRIKDPSGRG